VAPGVRDIEAVKAEVTANGSEAAFGPPTVSAPIEVTGLDGMTAPPWL
jgi:hypothetical protein